MCPDRQLLSVYLDGELPSPWKEKMETHLAGCPQCRERLESYRLFSANTANPGDTAAVMGVIQQRVWHNLENRLGSGNRRRFNPNLWRRRISLPLPAAAAAAILVVILAAFWVLKSPKAAAPLPNMIVASEENLVPGMISATDMNSVLQYLGSAGDGNDILVLRLPESRSFTSSGDPAMIRAADYSRNVPVRRQP